MGLRRILAVKNRNKKLIKFFLYAAIVVSAVLFLNHRKDLIIQQSTALLERVLSRESELDVHIGKIRGKILGEIQFTDVRVLTPGDSPENERLLFRTKEIIFRYHLLDFFSKKLDSKITVLVKDPEVYWRMRTKLRHNTQFPFMKWMREWALTQKENVEIQIQNLSAYLGPEKYKMEGIQLSYAKDSFKMEVPIRHLELEGQDVSTVIKVLGSFRTGLFYDEDAFSGEIFTEGTVVNWSPLPEESRFNFVFSTSGFKLISSDFLGGIEVVGEIDFEKDFDSHWTIKAMDYQLSNVSLFLKSAHIATLPAKIDLEISLDGSPWAPTFEGRARIYDGWVGKKTYKAMDISVSGVYPTLNLSGSRLLLQDGSTMRFADKTLEFWDLFRSKTYQELVSEAQQDTVVWGDWEFRRPRDINDQPEFLMQRTLGEQARLHFREYRQEESIEKEPTHQMEVGLEYKLLSPKNSLKLEFRENEEKFVGVERKVKF